jgi:hypothetical protein
LPPSPAAQERRRRVTGIRRTVAVLAVSAFLALWSGLFVQLRRGHDPALGATSSASSDSSGQTDGTTATAPATSDSLPSATTSQS